MDIFDAFDNNFGGHDISVNNHEYHTENNHDLGEIIYEDGKIIGHVQENTCGGNDFYNDRNEVIAHSHENVMGGQDVYSGYNHYEGMVHSNLHGIEYLDNDGGMDIFIAHEMGNASVILGYADPLSHVGSYIMPTMLL